MASIRQDQQGIFLPIILMPGHPLLGTSENHSSSVLISQHLTESDIRLCWPNFQLTALLLPSVNSFLAFYPIALYLLLSTAQPLHPSWPSGVPKGSVLSPTHFVLFIKDLLHASASDVHSFADDSILHKSSSFQCQPSSNALNLALLCLQLLTQICRTFPSEEPVI